MQKYRQYLLPSILTTLALALNEFVDCMLVSNLLGSNALAIANLGCPVILLIAACYVLLGNGGSMLYAVYLGKWKHESAGKVYRMSLVLAGVLGVLFFVIGIIFQNPISASLCMDEGLRPDFLSYYRVLLLTAPVLIVMLTFVCFLPPSGAPVIATIVNLVANGLNLVMDYVYIRFFNMGIEGAAWATITGYVIGFVVMLVLLYMKKVHIHKSRISLKDIKLSYYIVSLGLPAAVLQICFAIKYAVSNHLALEYGERTGVIAFSLCLQTFSIASVFLLGVADTAQPLLAMLSGQRDYKGEDYILKKSFVLQLVFSLALIVLFESFPLAIAAAYGVDDPDVLDVGLNGIRIFAITYLPRGIAIQFMRYFQVEQRKAYAFFISIMDGLLVIPIGTVLCRIYGINGVFISYPVAAAIMLTVIVILNIYIYNRNRESYTGIFLVHRDIKSLGTINLTITDKSEDISLASEKMIDFCTGKGVPMKQAFKVGLMCEEMAVYTRQHREDAGDIDLMLRIKEDEIFINFRSKGMPFDPTKGTEDDMPENILMIEKIASKVSYDYIMGMNSTQITIERGK